MKITERIFNPLQAILQVIPNSTPTIASVEQIQTLVGLLALGGVHCSSHEETVKCLQLLQDLDLITVVVIYEKNKIYIKLGNQYNGQ